MEKAQTAIRLNADGTSRIQYRIGDQVSFYLPPSEEAVKSMGKKKKHMLQFVGPGEIVEILSPNNTVFIGSDMKFSMFMNVTIDVKSRSEMI